MLASAPAVPAAPLPYATGDLPGTGGRIKGAPEDFVVEEQPRYAPSGSGEHLYLWVEKRGLTTAAVAGHLQRALAVPAAAVGYAGRKDAQAVTRQWISVHTPAEPDPARLERDGLRVLTATRHGNKLRLGHSAGNRFSVVVRDARRGDVAETLLARIAAQGFPNLFGPQRLGARNANALAGRALLHSPRTRTRGGLERSRFIVNAYQSALFNAVVARRLAELDALATLLPGDLALLHRNGAVFAVTEDGRAEAQTRAEAHEVSPSAPLYGYRVPLAAGRPGEWERALLEREGLTQEAFRLGSQRLSPKGERRPVRAFADALAWQWDDAATLRLTFALAPGVYATALLREVMKNDDLHPLPPPECRAAPPP